MGAIQKSIVGAAGAVAGAALSIAKDAKDKKAEEQAEVLAKKREAQKDLEHDKKVEILEAKKEQIDADKARKDAVLEAKLKESSIKQEGMKTALGQEAELRRLKIGEQRNRVLTSVEKLQLMRAKAADSLAAARDNKKNNKVFNISDRLSKIQKKGRNR